MTNKRKKLMTTAIAGSMAASIVIGGGTFAYLQSQTDDVVNEFKTEQVKVEISEFPHDPYDIIPGTEQDKDPSVTVKNTVEAFVFLNVTDNTYGLVTYEIDDTIWTKLEGYENVYYKKVPAAADENGTTLKVLKDDKVSYDKDLINEDMLDENGDLRTDVALSFNAFAIQARPFTDPTDPADPTTAPTDATAAAAAYTRPDVAAYTSKGMTVKSLDDAANANMTYAENKNATAEETASAKHNAAQALKDTLQNSTDKGIAILAEDKTIIWETEGSHGSSPLVKADNTTTKEVVIDGGENGGTMEVIGTGVGPIRAANDATVVFKNMTIIDNSKSYAETSWEFGYLEIGGKIRFENCHFLGGVSVGDSNSSENKAEFLNCIFETGTEETAANPKPSNMYSVWVDNGDASFTNCEFKGPYRGLKVHEAYGSDVGTVTVDSCTFGPLSKKPGIALGTLDSNTTVIVKNSKFDHCQEGEGAVPYAIESDTDFSTFNYTYDNNTILTD